MLMLFRISMAGLFFRQLGENFCNNYQLCMILGNRNV